MSECVSGAATGPTGGSETVSALVPAAGGNLAALAPVSPVCDNTNTKVTSFSHLYLVYKQILMYRYISKDFLHLLTVSFFLFRIPIQ